MENAYTLRHLSELLNKNTYIKTRDFKKDEIITTYISNRSNIYILLSGEAELMQVEADGNYSLIAYFNSGEIFGELFHSFNNSNELSVIARKRTQVLIFNYHDLIAISNLVEAKEISEIIFKLMSDKISSLNHRTRILTLRNTREKLLSYFRFHASSRYNRKFILPFSYSDLALYINADRSAMMREISHLIEEGFLIKKGREITLLRY